MWQNNKRFDFESYDIGTPGNSGFGLFHEPGQVPKPELPFSTSELIGIDLTHVIHTSDVAFAKGGNVGGGKGGGGSGGGKPGGGGGGGFDAVPYTSGPTDPDAGYNITIEFKGTWTESLYNIFTDAADRLTDLIIGEIQNVSVVGLKGGPKNVDDILITAELSNIDGAGGILGQAGPTSIRTDGHLPATAIMQFDIADASTYEQAGLFDDIVLHEMSHSLGFGSIWAYFDGLIVDGLYTGANAVAEYDKLVDGDNLVDGDVSAIPVETDGGSGTAGSHWDEESFDNELMTGYINDTNYFTAMSAASFADLGYQLAANYGGVADSGYILMG